MAAKQLCKGLALIRNQAHPRIATLELNRPKALNAITNEMYTNMTNSINQLSQDKETTFIILQGKDIGPKSVYSSGNDLKNFMQVDFTDPKKLQEGVDLAKNTMVDFVDAFINSQKPIVAKVDGLCYGIMCTSLGLCDYVYCTKKSTFTTPFTKIAQSPEGCSSIKFPEIFGDKLANEILLQNKTFDSKLAEKHGFVNKVYGSREELEIGVEKELQDMLALPERSFLSSRNLIKSHRREELLKVNRIEAENLIHRWSDFEELIPTIQKFFS